MLAPTGILVGLLYYFGYVTTDAWFRYFGLELSQVRLPQQAIVLQSIAALYLPVGCSAGRSASGVLPRTPTDDRTRCWTVAGAPQVMRGGRDSAPPSPVSALDRSARWSASSARTWRARSRSR